MKNPIKLSLCVFLIALLSACAGPKEKVTVAKAESPEYTNTFKSTRKTDIEKPQWEEDSKDAFDAMDREPRPEPRDVAPPREDKNEPQEVEPPKEVPVVEIKKEEPKEQPKPKQEKPKVKKPTLEEAAEQEKKTKEAFEKFGSDWEKEFVNDMESIKTNKFARNAMSHEDLVNLFPVSDEILLGESVAARTLHNFPEYKDQSLWEYVNFIGLSIVEVSDRNHIPYYFVILDDPEINAFAAPGGYVFITIGAVRFCENEAELAAILAHELAHVGCRHGIRALDLAKYRVMSEMMVNEMDKAFEENKIFDLDKSMDPRYKAAEKELVQIADQCFKQTQNPYNQTMEIEADDKGIVLMAKAGYQPKAAQTLMERLLQKMGEWPSFEDALHSHPPPSKRIQVIKNALKRQKNPNNGKLHKKRFDHYVKK